MTKLGDIIIVDTDDNSPGSAALVTHVWEDGTVNLRVFSDGLTGDEHRTLVQADGEKAEDEPAGAHAAPTSPPAGPMPTPASTTGAPATSATGVAPGAVIEAPGGNTAAPSSPSSPPFQPPSTQPSGY